MVIILSSLKRTLGLWVRRDGADLGEGGLHERGGRAICVALVADPDACEVGTDRLEGLAGCSGQVGVVVENLRSEGPGDLWGEGDE